MAYRPPPPLERPGFRSPGTELATSLHHPGMTRYLKDLGASIPTAPDERLASLTNHFEPTWRQAELLWRLLALVDDDISQLNWDDSLAYSTARAAEGLGEAEVLTLSEQLVSSLPDVSPQEAVAVLAEERLPWDRTWIEVSRPAHECPVIAQISFPDGDDPDALTDVRWVGALCRQRAEGIEILGITTGLNFGGPELACPAVFLAPTVPDVDPGNGGLVAYARTDDEGLDYMTALTADNTNALMVLATNIARRVAAVLMVLSAVNVSTEHKPMHGKRLRRWNRERHPRPHVVTVRTERGSAEEGAHRGGGGELRSSHMVRGHWMHFTKGPVFDNHPEARRYIPKLECEAVRIWRGSHVRGPKDAPFVPTVINLR